MSSLKEHILTKHTDIDDRKGVSSEKGVPPAEPSSSGIQKSRRVDNKPTRPMPKRHKLALIQAQRKEKEACPETSARWDHV